MIKIENYLINKNNITFIDKYITDTDNYVWKKTYRLIIGFVGGDKIRLQTYDEEECNKWLEELEK